MPHPRLRVFALALATSVAAQAPPPPAEPQRQQPTATLLVRLKSKRTDLEQAEDIVGQLRGRRTRARIQASTALRRRYLDEAKAYARLAARAFAALQAATQKAQRARLGTGGGKKVAALRDEALSVTRGSGLSSDAIRREIDPRVAELEQLLLPSVAEIYGADDGLDVQLTELRLAHRELRQWYAVYASVTEGLELHEDAQKHFAKLPPPRAPGDEGRIDAELKLARFSGLPMAASDRSALRDNEALRAVTPSEEFLGTLELNRRRYLLGLRLLRIDARLADAARDHSVDMAERGFFSHTSPIKGKERFGQRAANFGTSASAENIAAGQQTGAGAVRAWWYSPGHHRNMLGGHGRTGLGQHRTMWTQMFGG
jgi:hypothetical protein